MRDIKELNNTLHEDDLDDLNDFTTYQDSAWDDCGLPILAVFDGQWRHINVKSAGPQVIIWEMEGIRAMKMVGQVNDADGGMYLGAKDCWSCKHGDKATDDDPCFDCFDNDEWVWDREKTDAYDEQAENPCTGCNGCDSTDQTGDCPDFHDYEENGPTDEPGTDSTDFWVEQTINRAQNLLVTDAFRLINEVWANNAHVCCWQDSPSGDMVACSHPDNDDHHCYISKCPRIPMGS